jgi:hypothetical protein
MTDIPPEEQPSLDGLTQWRERRRKFLEEASADYARRHAEDAPRLLDPIINAMLRGIARVLRREIDEVKRELRAEIDVCKVHLRREIELRRAQRPRRRKKMTRAEMNAFVMSKPRAPK